MESDDFTIVHSEVPNIEQAKIFLPRDLLDPQTIAQIKHMVSNPNVAHVRVMPDCHVGQACCIGFTAIVGREIVPSFIGGDIGCGILTYPLKKQKINLVRTEATIRSLIPMGNGHHSVHVSAPITESYVCKWLERANEAVNQFCSEKCIDLKIIDFGYLQCICNRVGVDYGTLVRSFGTLGGGNHFIEINQDDVNLEYFLTIHSGSRTFGQKLFEYYNKKVSHISNTLSEADSIEYCIELIIAQYLAQMNRYIMLELILRELNCTFDQSHVIESVHNYIDFGRMIIRKGAVSAENGQNCVVALNMRDGICICEGKGNVDWNYSCAHGCGRFMSRSEAKRRIKLREFKQAMKDVVSSTVTEGALDEAPQAYKDPSIVLNALSSTVTVKQRLVSVMNLKGVD